MTPWAQNDALFFQECAKGHFWEQYAAAFLRQQGLRVVLGEQSFRETIVQASDYAQQIDLTVEGVPVEVKSRAMDFYGTPSSYPYQTSLVDTASGWEKKDPKPEYLLLVSQTTGCFLWLDVVKSVHAWDSKSRLDRTRGLVDTFLEVSREWLRPIPELIQVLKRRKPAPFLGGDELPHPGGTRG